MSERSVNPIKVKLPAQGAIKRRGSVSKFNKAIISSIAPPLEWYRLTENSRNVLNAVITFAAKEEVKEASKSNPDKKRIDYLKGLYIEAHDVTRNSRNFESLEKMKEIVQRYHSILQSIRHD